MPPAPRWISVSAISVLGIGIVATGAVGVANAMPLVDSTTTAAVPPISTVPATALGDVKGWGGSQDLTFSVPASSPAVTSTVEPAPAQPAPAPPPQPVSPDSVSAASPASVDSVD